MSTRDPELLKVAEARVGKTLCGKWHLDRLLDIGGMAAVYVATHRNGNQVAVKILHPIFPENSNVKKRFLREGYLANKVKHPSAVTVLDDDVAEDGSMFLVMELLSGQSVEALLQASGGVLGVQHVLAIADQTLDVLAVAHQNGVIHRDIKPGNLFLTDDGQVKVLDFGLARLKVSDPKTALTGVGVIMGTSSYMSPEQARSKWDIIDGRTDLWAVGAVMFRLLSGHVVHEAATPTDRLLAAMSKKARSLATVMPNAPRSLVELVDKSLAFDMADRWANATEMQTAVRQTFAIISSPEQQRIENEPTISAQADQDIDVLIEYSSSKPDGPPTTKSPGEISILDLDDVIDLSEDDLERLPEMSAVLVEELLTESDIQSVFKDDDKSPKH